MAIIKTNWKKANQDTEKDDYSSIIPSGFKQKKYNTSIVPGGYLYHRCHIIAWKLGGIDVDKRNLMTGTQSFNINGMKPFEDKVYDYIKENKKNNVLYRVTPYFEENNELVNYFAPKKLPALYLIDTQNMTYTLIESKYYNKNALNRILKEFKKETLITPQKQ